MSVSLEQFTENIVRSGLITADEFTVFQNGLQAGKKPADAKELARDLINAGKLTKYQAQSIYSGRTSGLVIDQYVVLDKIGEGGMGVVLKGQHRRMKRTVAIKALQTRRLGSADAVQRFHREVEAAAKLNHQNIVTAHDAREQDGIHYLIMEFVDGHDLASTLHELGPLPVHKVLDYVLQTARGLEYAHRQGIIHRDIKPANLLLGKDGTVKILDMGLARLIDEAGATAVQPGSNKGEHLTRTGDVMGTCDYMAPEQGHDSHKVDGRADIYSLGCTLYRLLTGRRPYTGDSMVQVLMAHRNSPIPSLRALRPELSEQLDAVCKKMMAKRPKDRFLDMTEVIAALDAIVHPQRPSSTSFDDDDASTNTRSLRENLSFLSPQPTVAITAKPVDAFKETVSYHQEQDTGSSSAAQGAPLDNDPLLEEPPTPQPPIAKTQAAALSGKTAARTSGAHAVKKRKRQLPLIAVMLASLAVIGIVIAFTIFTFPLGEGTVVIENEADLATKDIEVTASHGEEVKVASQHAGWTITLKPGEYKLDVKGTVVGLSNDHIELDQNNITVTRGSKQVVKIKLVAPTADPEGAEARKVQELGAKELGKPVDYNNSIGMSFVLVPSGAFMMGSPMDWLDSAATEVKANSWFFEGEKNPKSEAAHHVRITKPFYLGIYTVTQEQYQHIMGVNPSYFCATGGGSSAVTGEDCSRRPVECVSWDDANEFCKKLSARPDEKAKDHRYRLPTEAEWEYACRAGTKTLWHFGDDESNLGLYDWYLHNSAGKTHEVGKLKSNPWGLFDLYGNVGQICQDRYLESYYEVTDNAADPVSASANLDAIVVRGGHIGAGARKSRSGTRHAVNAGSDQYSTVGVRVVLEAGPKSGPEEPETGMVSLAAPMKRPTPVHVEIKHDPLQEFKPGEPLSKLALVAQPAAIKGVASWTIETSRHRGIVTAMAFSPDSKQLALGGEDGTIRILNPADGTLIRALVGAQQAIDSIAWSPDGTMLVSGPHQRGPAMVWEVGSGRLLRHDLFNEEVSWVDWSPDGRRIAGLTTWNQDAVIVDLVDGTQTAIPCQDGATQTLSWGVLAWSPDGNELAFYRRERKSPGPHAIHIWDVVNRRPLQDIDQKAEFGSRSGRSPDVMNRRPLQYIDQKAEFGSRLSWSPDGTMLAFLAGGVVKIMNSRSGEIARQTAGKIDQVSWAADGRSIYLESAWSNVESRNISTWSRRWITTSDGRFKCGCAASPDGKQIVTSGRFSTCTVIDCTTGSYKTDLRGHVSFTQFQQVSLSKDGTTLVARRDEGSECLWDTGDFRLSRTISVPHQPWHVSLSRDGGVLSYDNADNVFVATTSPANELAAMPIAHNSAFPYSGTPSSVSDNGKLLLVKNPSVTVWDIATKAVVCKVPLNQWAATAHNPEATKLAIASDKGAKLYEIKTGLPIKTLTEATTREWLLAWSPNGERLAGSSIAGGIDVWDVASGKHLGDRDSLAKAACFQEGRKVEALAWMDNDTLLLGNNSGSCVWSLTSRSIVREMPGGNFYWAMTGCFFGPGTGKHDGKVAFTGAAAILLRSLDDGRLFYTIVLLSDDPQKCAVVGPDGHWKGKPALADQFVYVVQTDLGQETLTPAEFEKKYGWKNDPSKAVAK